MRSKVQSFATCMHAVLFTEKFTLVHYVYIRLQKGQRLPRATADNPLRLWHNRTQKGKITDADGSLPLDSDREMQDGQSRGNQSIIVHAPTTVVMNNISTTTISRGYGRKSAHGQFPSDVASERHQTPFQPRLGFPGQSFGSGRPRSFNSGWYMRFPWIEYSVECDAAFCYPCRLLCWDG